MKRDNASYGYFPIHMRSSFSLLRGILSPEKICRLAKEGGAQTVGISDINNTYGLVRFLKAAASEGVKPLASVVLCPDGKPSATVFIMTRKGLVRINGLITALLLRRTYSRRADRARMLDNRDYGKSGWRLPASDWSLAADLLENGWEGLRLASDNVALLNRLRERNTEGLYVKLIYGRPIAALVRWASKLGLPTVALNDGVCVSDDDRELYRTLRAIDLNTPVDDLPKVEALTPA